MSEFRRYGAVVPFGDAEVSLADVAPIRDIAARELLDSARAPKIDLSEGRDYTRYSHYFPSLDEWSQDASDRFITAQLSHYAEPEQAWYLAINVRSYALGERNSNKRICYRMESYGDRLLQAKKEVFFVLGKSNIVMGDDGEPQEVVDTVRKAYERQMQPNDCESLLGLLQRGVRRARTLRAAP
ncbi:MAG: hypothetical protein ACHQT5_01030 [Candidatus Saccharimonadales bacterium]|jgi:hypothetical protein